MALQLGFFYRMDAVVFRRLQTFRQHFDNQYLNQKLINFIPLIEINSDDYKNYEMIKNQIRQYCFLLDQQHMKSRVKFDSYQISNRSEVHLNGSYQLKDLKEIFIDLKILLENHFSNNLVDFSERFLEPSMKLIHHFNESKLDDLLSRIGLGEDFKFYVDLKNFGYIELNSMGCVENLYQEFSDSAKAPSLFSTTVKNESSKGDFH